jgi:tetratricopeptide (TPR) repeat protein
LVELGRFREAEAAYERALELEPRSADSLSNLAGLYKEQGRMDEAVGYYDLAVGFAPDVPSIRYNRSLALLKAGDYSRGWSEYEWRWRRGQEKHRLHPGPRWDGSALAGRTVLIWAEQGLGDALQFVRYAPRGGA